MTSAALLYVFYGQLHAGLVTVYGSMFCSVIHKRSPYILHPGHDKQISHEYNHSKRTGNQTLYKYAVSDKSVD